MATVNEKIIADYAFAVPEDATNIEDEDTSGEMEITSPFDPTQIRVEFKPLTIDLLLERIRQLELDLSPGFQRKSGIWKEDVKSRLIESLLIRIPLPAFYFDATDDDCWLAVDGAQRLSTLKEFVVDEKLRLRGLDFLTQFENYTYDMLPRNFQRRILETQVTAYLITKGTPDDVKFIVFKRINTAGLPLSAQEIRHALNQGKATQFLADLADSEEFQEATGGVIDSRMGDREFVLRFLAFIITPYTRYRGDLDKLLNDTMKDLNNRTDSELKTLSQRFSRVMEAATRIFGIHAFRKPSGDLNRRRPINKPLFETWSVNLDQLNDHQIEILVNKRAELNIRFVELLGNDPQFANAITFGTGSITKVKIRFEKVKEIIMEVLA